MIPFLLIFSLVLITLYLVLQSLRNTSMERRLTGPERVFAGIFSWAMIFFWCIWIGTMLFGVFLTLQGNLDGLMLTIVLIVLLGLTYRFSQALDTYQVLDFIQTAMWFHPYTSQPFVMLDEVDKKKIRDIHKTTSHTAFPTAEPEKTLKTREEVQKIQQELREFQRRPKKPLLLDGELKELNAGHRVNISESWKLNTLNRTSHDLYEEIESMDVDPSTLMLTFQVNIRAAMQERLTDPALVFSITQDLYDLLQAIHTESWMRPYRPYYKNISVFCLGMMLDEYGRENPYTFMHIVLKTIELERRAGTFFNVKELSSIARITFQDGQPIV